MQVRIAGITNDSIVDGPGIRLTVFVQGCIHNCQGCHNPQTHSLDGGELMDTSEIIEKMDRNILLDGITLSGGEPFMQPEPLSLLAKAAHERGLSVIAYTGYRWEELLESYDKYAALLENTDYVIDGKFIESLKSLGIRFRGSKNQRVIDVSQSLEQNRCIEHEF